MLKACIKRKQKNKNILHTLNQTDAKLFIAYLVGTDIVNLIFILKSWLFNTNLENI